MANGSGKDGGPAKRPARPKAPGKAKAKPRAKATAKPRAKARPKAKPAAAQPPRDLWFRFSTRVRAGGYWVREKAQAAGRGLRSAGEWVADFWQRRSIGARIGIGAGAVLILLLIAVRLFPVPGVPCQVSVAECAPEQRSLELVPADALMYAHLTLDRDSEQFQQAEDAFESLSDLRTVLAAELPGAIDAPSGEQIDAAADILPWADRELALLTLPGPRAPRAFIAGVGDRSGAEEFLGEVAPAGQPRTEQVGDAELTSYADGFSSAFVDESLVLGDDAAVRAALATAAGDAPALQDRPQGDVVDELPDVRFAEVYLSRAGVRSMLVGRGGAAAQLETFVDYGATDGMAAAAVSHDDGVEVELVSSLDPRLTKRSPSFFSELPEFEPGLADEAGSRAIGFLTIGDFGPTLADLVQSSGGRGGLAGSLRDLADGLQRQAGVDPLTELLPALGGQAALVAEPTDGVPFASLVVDGVDEQKAADALARLQRPVLRSIGTGGGAVPRFEEKDVDGVAVRSVQVSPTIDLSYAVFDGMLVISTDPSGVAQVLQGGDSLADSGAYERATEDLPDQVSALVFLNLDELFGQVTRTDLVEDPFFANLSVLFDNAESLGLAVNGEKDQIRSELFLATD